MEDDDIYNIEEIMEILDEEEFDGFLDKRSKFIEIFHPNGSYDAIEFIRNEFRVFNGLKEIEY